MYYMAVYVLLFLCVSGINLRDGQIPCAEESYRMCVCVCVIECGQVQE